MQRPSSYYAFSRCDSQVWTDWLQSERLAEASWGSSVSAVSASLEEETSRHRSKDDVNDAMPLCYASFLPSPPDSPLSTSSSSQLSVVSVVDSGYDELPEIPFVSSSPSRFNSGWNPMEGSSQGSDDSHCERTFWASVIRPSASRSSDKSMPVLGHMNDRLLPPGRQRAPSVSSTASSRTRPAPAKSILSSSSSSTRTRATTRSPPSVKFLDMPTIHYEEEGEAEPARPASPEDSGKRGFLRWIRGASRRAQPAQERPSISGPFPLWETPPRRSHSSGAPSVRSMKSGAPSLRSMKSNNSLRSVRSCSSRLQTYWSRMTGQDT